jgi:hypothetical protein
MPFWDCYVFDSLKKYSLKLYTSRVKACSIVHTLTYRISHLSIPPAKTPVEGDSILVRARSMQTLLI